MKEHTRTAEFVTPKHPDKICDFLADSILDAYLAQDKTSRVAIELCAGHNAVMVNGEVTSAAQVDASSIIKNILGEHFSVTTQIAQQSPFIAQGVDTGGAGDQGIMVGYACSETENCMPQEYELARNLCKKIYATYPYDGKVQVTVTGDEVDTVVASFQHSKNADLQKIVESAIAAKKYFINPAGEWTQGGFDADSGLSGRKLVVDAYGPRVSIGGGSFSGKDYTKVDRSGAYMARKIAVDILHTRNATEVLVKLAYAIGVAEPVMAVAFVDGVEENIRGTYNMTPKAIIQELGLAEVQYAQTCQWGHFGNNFVWDRPF